ncbi:hypothetical protein AB0R99_00105 [Erwinia amylovora]|uniref:hypothetical protein n=1 Tax=Erwinia amylovora TaxID=552 RepID=UPI0037DC0FC0
MKANFLLKLIAKDKGIKEFEISSWDCDIKELKDDNSDDVIELQKDLSYGYLITTLLINGKEVASGSDDDNQMQ